MLGSLDPEATIAAVATPPGHALRGIVRLSGPRAWPIALGLLDEASAPGVGTRRGHIHLDGLHAPLPAAVTSWRSPRSYTGEDVCEIHTTGSPPLLGLVLAACLARGARHAQPGEFTLRAFLRGRLDLTRAEAVLGVIDAGNPAQLDAALEQLAGGLSRPIVELRDRLLDVVAHLEANLDFVEEADVDSLDRPDLERFLSAAAVELGALVERISRRGRGVGHPRVVLTGPPNAGKSRLFNALAGHDGALVSPRAGTTRDYLTALCSCDGTMVELVDTAGVEAPEGSINAQAQTLREHQARRADLVLRCSSLDTEPVDITPPDPAVSSLHVVTKSDLGRVSGEAPGMISTSAATGTGLDALRQAIARTLEAQRREGDLPASTAARCRDSLAGAIEALGRAAAVLTQRVGDELIAMDLRLAVDELGKVVGAVYTDDILDRIFLRFCIGK